MLNQKNIYTCREKMSIMFSEIYIYIYIYIYICKSGISGSGVEIHNRAILLMVTSKYEDAKFLYYYKFGRKIENEVENIWINSDLTKTERKEMGKKNKNK